MGGPSVGPRTGSHHHCQESIYFQCRGDSDIFPDHYSGGPDRAYNQFYGAMKSWGRYELVAAPADADLILELHFAAPTGAVDVTNGSGGSAQHPQFRLVIRDVKTNTVLWTFTERLQTASRRAAHDQSFDQAMDKIVDDIKSHLVRTPVTPEAPGK